MTQQKSRVQCKHLLLSQDWYHTPGVAKDFIKITPANRADIEEALKRLGIPFREKQNGPNTYFSTPHETKMRLETSVPGNVSTRQPADKASTRSGRGTGVLDELLDKDPSRLEKPFNAAQQTPTAREARVQAIRDRIDAAESLRDRDYPSRER